MSWITYGQTESCDALPVLDWGDKKPSVARVEQRYKELLPIEFDEVGFVHWYLEEAILA